MICCIVFFFQAEDGIRDLVRSRGLGDVYKRQDKRNIFFEITDGVIKLSESDAHFFSVSSNW